MKLLTANDEQGAHAPSWYHATCDTPSYPELNEDVTCDVCVIGAGYTGLSTALHLSKRGHNVIVVDAHRVGWGASGRNGGQLGSGLNIDQTTLEKIHGRDHAHALWQVCENAKNTIHTICADYDINARYKPGLIAALHRPRLLADAQQYVEKLRNDYAYPHVQMLSQSELRSLVDSPIYHGGVIDHGAGHIHPLALATGLAKAASSSGVKVFELSEVLAIDEPDGKDCIVKTSKGHVQAPVVVLACNGYLDSLNTQVQQHVMPINNFIIATEPLGTRAEGLLSADHAVFDSRFVVNYFRRSHDNRLLFGGGETYGYRFPDDIAALVKKPLLQVFPQLSDVRIDYAWGGTLAITTHRAPYVRELKPNFYSASGYSGHGVALSVEAGKLIAEAIDGDKKRLNTMALLTSGRFPGGTRTRSVLLKAAMSWYAFRDKF